MNEERSTPRLERWVPGVRVARTYDRSWLRPDLIAGIVLAAILVPQGMAYAELAGLPPVTGLYTTIACLLGLCAVLGRVEGLDGWHSVRDQPDARQIQGIVVYRWEAPLFFANAGIFRQQIRHLVRERQPSWVVLQCEAITDIDVTAAEMLERLDNELNAAGVHMAFAEMRARLQDMTLRYGLFETLDRDHFYPTLDSAIAAIETRPHASRTLVQRSVGSL